jgi:uncharacterized membrane protein
MFHFAQAAMGGRHSAAGQQLDHRYGSLPGARRYFRTVTLVWGSAFLIEAAVKVVVIETSSTGSALTFTRIAPYALLAVLLPWTIAWGRAIRRRAAGTTAATI